MGGQGLAQRDAKLLVTAPDGGPYERVTVSRPVGGVLSAAGAAGWPSIYAAYLGRRAGHPPQFGLAPGGVYRAARVTPGAGALLPHRFTLACATEVAIGGLLSVALSCGSPRLGVAQHPALWSPDVPRTGPASPLPGTRPPGRLAAVTQ